MSSTVKTEMSGKVCIITGANNGIGKATAVALAKMGADIGMICRDCSRGESAQKEIQAAARGGKVNLHISDLSSQQSVRAVAGELLSKYEKIDVLINNAGIVQMSREVSTDGIELTMATNHMGPFLLTKLLLPTLEKTPGARIVNVSSALHVSAKLHLDDLQFERRSYSGMTAYSQSKLMNAVYSAELARRLEGTGVTSNSLHPGAVSTALGSDNESSPLMIIWNFWKRFLISPDEGAKTSVYLASSEKANGVSGKYFSKSRIARASRLVSDPKLGQELWSISESLLKS